MSMPNPAPADYRIHDLLRQRWSPRAFAETPVRPEQPQRLLEAARWAPSWANTQCWEVILVRDEDMKRRIAEAVPPGNPARTALVQAPVLVVACARLGKGAKSP